MSPLTDAIGFAQAQLGKPYVWGGTGPDGYDCSGLTQGAFKAAGYSIPRTSQEQRNAGVGVDLSQIRPGDLVTFTYPDSGGNPGPGNHVALYIGAGQVIEAAHRGVPVKIAPMDVAHVDRVRRILGTTVNPGDPSAPTGGTATQADNTSGSGVTTAGLQQAGYDAVINLTPWGIPLNPFKLPGWLEGQLGKAEQGVTGGLTKGLIDSIGPIALAVLGVGLGAALVLGGAYLAAEPHIEAKVEEAAKIAAAAA